MEELLGSAEKAPQLAQELEWCINRELKEIHSLGYKMYGEEDTVAQVAMGEYKREDFESLF